MQCHGLNRLQAETEKSENLYLYIDLPRFDFPVIFTEGVCSSSPSIDVADLSQDATPSVPSTSTTVVQPPPSATTVTANLTSDPYLWAVVDPDIAKENPVEDKHRRLVRSHRSSPYDRELKPNAKIRDELNVCYPYIYVAPSTHSHKLTRRIYLTTHRASRLHLKRKI